MPFCVYILYSSGADKYYIGQTENIKDRLFRHNNSGSKYTKGIHDWKVVYTEYFSTRSEAVKRETEIKNKKSKKYIQFLINSVG